MVLSYLFLERSSMYYGSAKNLEEVISYLTFKNQKVEVVLAEKGELCTKLDANTGVDVNINELPSTLNKYGKALINQSIISKVQLFISWLLWSLKVIATRCIKNKHHFVVLNNTRSFYFFLLPVLFMKVLQRKIIWRIQIDTPIHKFSRVIFLFISDLVIVHGGELTAKKVLGEPLFNKYKSKLHHWYNPVDTKRMQEKKNSVFTNEKSKFFTVLTVALLEERKGIQHLIEAAKSLPDVRFIHIGGEIDGQNYLKQLQQLVSLYSVEDRFTFLGKQDCVLSYMAECDLFSLVSKNETMPYVISEAMYSSLPILASPVGGVPYLVSDRINGYFIDYGNVDDIVSKIKKLKDDPELCNKMGAESRKMLLEKKSLDESLNDLVSRIRNLKS